MKRKQIIRRLAEEVANLERDAAEAAGYGFYDDAARQSDQAQGVRRALALLDPEHTALPENEARWHHSELDDEVDP